MRLRHAFCQHPLLATSLLLNVLLAGIAGILAIQPGGAPPPPISAAQPPPVVEAAPTVIVKTKPFHWRELDAPDFEVFVANLRQIGCPELTIQDIVAGELREIYTAKRVEVLRAPQAAANRTQAAVLAQLEIEQSQLLARLLGQSAQAQAQASDATSVHPELTAHGLSGHSPLADIPAAFLLGDAGAQAANLDSLSTVVTDSTLDPTTTRVLSQMREQFATDVQTATAAEPNPASPTYRARWQNLKRNSDEYFSSMFGGDTFVRVQLQAAQQAAAAGK